VASAIPWTKKIFTAKLQFMVVHVFCRSDTGVHGYDSRQVLCFKKCSVNLLQNECDLSLQLPVCLALVHVLKRFQRQ
jgi:hypothetical protein